MSLDWKVYRQGTDTDTLGGTRLYFLLGTIGLMYSGSGFNARTELLRLSNLYLCV